MSIASVNGRLRAQRKAARLAAEDARKPRREWPELSYEERLRMSQVDEAVIRARGGPQKEGEKLK